MANGKFGHPACQVLKGPSSITSLLDQPSRLTAFSPRTGPTAGPFLGRCSTRKYVGSTSSKVLFVLPWPEGRRRNTYLALKPRTLRTPTLPQLRLPFIDLRYKLINCIHARSIHTTSTIEDPLGVLRNAFHSSCGPRKRPHCGITVLGSNPDRALTNCLCN